MENSETARYADIFAALGSESRLEIMRLLLTAYPNGLTVGEIQAQLQIPNSTLSHHLEKLRIEGLVNTRRDKQYQRYSAEAKTIEEVLSFLYHGCSTRTLSVEPVTHTSTQAGFMFENLFESIFTKLFGSMSQKVTATIFFQKSTQKVSNVLQQAQIEARRMRHDFMGTEQILLGLMGEESDVVGDILKSMGVNLNNARLEVEKIIGRGSGSSFQIPYTPRAKRVLELALEEAERLGHNYVSTEHLLLALLREGQGVAVRVLEILGVDLRNLEQRVLEVMN